MSLTQEQYLRYSRHIILPEIGLQGQKKLLEKSVVVIGVGGLGCPAVLYLAAAGVGRIGLVDFDRVDVSNLHRQVLYAETDIGELKVEVAKKKIQNLNPDVRVDIYPVRLSKQNALDILSQYDVVIDGTDNFPTRYLTNDACVFLEKPFVYGSIFRFEGQVSVFLKGKGPCYRCLFPEPPPPGSVPTCAEAGVLGVLPGVIGTLQATEALKLLLDVGDTLVGRFIVYHALNLTFREIRIRPNPQCPICSPNPRITELIEYEHACEIEGITHLEEVTISPVEVKRKLDAREDFLLLDVREPDEYEIVRIEGSKFIPLSQIVLRLHELDAYRNREIVIYCHKGGRSLTAVQILKAHGFERVFSMNGGIDAWADIIDPSLPKY